MDRRFGTRCVILTLIMASGCIPKATATSAPISTWIAEGMPGDLVICYSSSGNAGSSSVTISADGTVNSTLQEFEWPAPNVANGTKKISQDELKQILLLFAKADFFSLQAFDEYGCLYNIHHPTKEEPHPESVDCGWSTISIALHDTFHSVKYYGCCTAFFGEDNFFTLQNTLAELCSEVAGEPKPVTPTPE